jgi:putative phage-type endonuclease
MPELVPAEPLSPEWHAARRAGVTATDIVTILGLSSYDSQYSLYWRKLGQVPDQPERDRLELGKFLEPFIVERWDREHEGEFLTAGGLYRHSGRPWQMATLDAKVNDGEPLELKSWADADKKRWEDGPIASVRAQLLWQMDVREAARGHVGVVFLPSGEFRSYTIVHQPQTLAEVAATGSLACDVCDDLKIMRAAGAEFMARLRLELPPPDPDASAATLAAVRARFTRQPDKQAEIDPAVWDAYDEARDLLDEAKGEAQLWEINVREQAGEASVLTVNGRIVARRIIVDADVKAHHRHQDYLKRIEPKGDDSE